MWLSLHHSLSTLRRDGSQVQPRRDPFPLLIKVWPRHDLTFHCAGWFGVVDRRTALCHLMCRPPAHGAPGVWPWAFRARGQRTAVHTSRKGFGSAHSHYETDGFHEHLCLPRGSLESPFAADLVFTDRGVRVAQTEAEAVWPVVLAGSPACVVLSSALPPPPATCPSDRLLLSPQVLRLLR